MTSDEKVNTATIVQEAIKVEKEFDLQWNARLEARSRKDTKFIEETQEEFDKITKKYIELVNKKNKVKIREDAAYGI